MLLLRVSYRAKSKHVCTVLQCADAVDARPSQLKLVVPDAACYQVPQCQCSHVVMAPVSILGRCYKLHYEPAPMSIQLGMTGYCSLQGVVYSSPRVDEVNMSRDHSHGNIHVHNRADDSAHAATHPKPHAEDEAMV